MSTILKNVLLISVVGSFIILCGLAELLKAKNDITVYESFAKNISYAKKGKEKAQVSLLDPRLRPICGLESSWEGTEKGEPQQYNPDGSIRINTNYHKNGTVSRDWGACQINDRTWDGVAKKLGLDYKHSIAHNYKMANWILKNDKRGILNWVSYYKKLK